MMRSAAPLLLALCLTGAGCARSGQLPGWAMHVPPPRVDLRLSTLNLKPRLLFELAQDRYGRGFVSPEQLAAVAVAELRAGNDWDAAVLLAFASYRYHEQAFEAYRYGSAEGFREAMRRTRGHLRHAQYGAFLKAEVEIFNDTHFDEELERIASTVGAPLDTDSVEKDIARVAMGNVSDRHTAARALKARFDNLQAPPAERLAYPDLARALRDRLVRDTARRDHASHALFYLCHTPLRSFREAALGAALSYQNGNLVRAGLRVYQAAPLTMLDGLRSARAQTRSHAALVLGTAEALERLPAIEKARASERDLLVWLSMTYALVRVGEHQYLPQLLSFLGDGDASVRAHTLFLVQWLPLDLQLGVSEDTLARATGDEALPAWARVTAAATLRDIARRRPLVETSVGAMLEVARAMQSQEELAGYLNGFIGELEQLERHRVLTALSRREAPLAGWLARFEQVAAPQDLPLLAQMLQAIPPADTNLRIAVVRAVAKVPGVQAQDLLSDWFTRYGDLRTATAIQLVLRQDVDKRRLSQVASSVYDPNTLLMRLPLNEGDSERMIAAYTNSARADDRLIAALALKLFGNREQGRYLWANIDYHDARFYPGDVRVRQLSLSALLDIELNRKRSAGEGAAL